MVKIYYTLSDVNKTKGKFFEAIYNSPFNIIDYIYFEYEKKPFLVVVEIKRKKEVNGLPVIIKRSVGISPIRIEP